MEVKRVVRYFKKKNDFALKSMFVDFSNFENLNFQKKLIYFELKFPVVGSKFLLEISVKNPDQMVSL